MLEDARSQQRKAPGKAPAAEDQQAEQEHDRQQQFRRLVMQRRIHRKKDPAKSDKELMVPDLSEGKGSTADKNTPVPGDKGILSAETTTQIDGKDAKLAAGTVVEVIGGAGDHLRVKVFSGHEGKQAKINVSSFKAEPGVVLGDDKKERDDVYQEYSAPLWDPKAGPTAADVRQGFIGDCYLMAAMTAIVARDPGAIKRLFSPQTPNQKSYTVTLHERQGKGWATRSVTVDTQLPSIKDKDHAPAYANNDKGKSGALWPALLEKAYAVFSGGILQGSYADIGDGGDPSNAMSTLTGVASEKSSVPKDEKTIIADFERMQKEGKAIVCSTLGEVQTTQKKIFKRSGPLFTAHLITNEGLDCEVVESSVKIDGTASKKPFSASDDGKGKIVGASIEKGTVDYNKPQNFASLQFKKGQEPDAPENIDIAYKFRGQLNDSINLHANHAYAFERVDGGKIFLKNPWGFSDPKRGLTAAEFKQYFQTINTNEVKPAGK
jgi:hypothetical protein